MSGTSTTTSTVTATGDQYIDGILTDAKWADSIIYYSFSTSSAAYNYTSSDTSITDLPAHFRTFTAAQKTAAEFALDGTANAAAFGFSIAGFTLANIQSRGEIDSTSGTQIRFGGTTSSTLGTSRVADFPGNYISSDLNDNGDVWIGNAYDGNPTYDYRAPTAGNYAWATHLHEIGHAMGLKHPHETGFFGAGPTDEDTVEFTVMSYRSYENASVSGGLTNEQWGFEQTYMMLDIAALQHMYGADYTTNSGNTVYKWTPGSGNTVIDGSKAIEPGDNRIFATIWDGGGTDTYDLSAYSSSLSIDLRPGKWSVFDADQLADLGDGHTARGSIFNALEYQNNKASLVENAIGGTGDDAIVGNGANNVLTGGLGADSLSGGAGTDTASYSTATAAVIAKLASSAGNTGDAAGDTYVSIENLTGSAFADVLTGDGKRNEIDGGSGRDTIKGGAGKDVLVGGAGADKLDGGSAADTFLYHVVSDSLDGNNHDTISGFIKGDIIELSDIDTKAAAGDQAFSFIGDKAFSGKAAQLDFDLVNKAGTANDETFVFADLDGDKKADFEIQLTGLHTLTKSDFAL